MVNLPAHLRDVPLPVEALRQLVTVLHAAGKGELAAGLEDLLRVPAHDAGTLGHAGAWTRARAMVDALGACGVDVAAAQAALRGEAPRPRRKPRVGTPLDAARVALGIAELVWLGRCEASAKGVQLDGTATPLRRACAALAEAVEEAEAAVEGSEERRLAMVRVDQAIAAVDAEVRPVDSVVGLLRVAGRLVRGEKRSAQRPGR